MWKVAGCGTGIGGGLNDIQLVLCFSGSVRSAYKCAAASRVVVLLHNVSLYLVI